MDFGGGDGEGKVGVQAFVIVLVKSHPMKAQTKASPGVGKDRKDLKYFGVEYYGLVDQSVAMGEGGSPCLQVTVAHEIHGRHGASPGLGLLSCQRETLRKAIFLPSPLLTRGLFHFVPRLTETFLYIYLCICLSSPIQSDACLN